MEPIQNQDFEKMYITPDDLGTASKVLDIFRASFAVSDPDGNVVAVVRDKEMAAKVMAIFKAAIPVTNPQGNVVAFVRDEAIAKKVQWAIASQAETAGV